MRDTSKYVKKISQNSEKCAVSEILNLCDTFVTLLYNNGNFHNSRETRYK